MFQPKDQVKVVSTFYGNANSFVGMSGVVTAWKDGWVMVSIPTLSDTSPIPFRERELDKAD